MKGFTRGALARALYSNTPEAPNELLFRKGDILTVIEYDYEGQTGWWLCALRGQRGICPGNYLQLLEDNYSFVDRGRPKVSRSLSHTESSRDSSLVQDPLETYDFPRSYQQSQSQTLPRRLSSRSNSHSSEAPEYANLALENDQPIYQNEELLDKTLPTTTTATPTPTPVDDLIETYDVPRSHSVSQLSGIYGQSLTRLRRYGSSTISSRSDLGLPPKGLRASNNSNSARVSPDNLSGGSFRKSETVSGNGETASSAVQLRRASENGPTSFCGEIFRKPIGYPSSINNNRGSVSASVDPSNQVQLRRPPATLPKPNLAISNNRASSSSGESGIVMLSASSGPSGNDLYDVPRSYQHQQHQQQCPSSRPSSSLSGSSSGMGRSITDSKDSILQDFYDVPRSAKYVSHMEAKYDTLSSSSSNDKSSSDNLTLKGHSRTNSTSSIFSAYGYSRNQSNQFLNQELYDVPRSENGNGNGRDSRGSLSSITYYRNQNQDRMNSSMTSSRTSLQSDNCYDIPPAFARKVSLSASSDNSDTLSYKSDRDLPSSASDKMSMGMGISGSLSSIRRSSNGGEVKILPLGPKAAVSVCEKLRHEVVTSITNILDLVKPKWRSKENLTVIIDDLRFSATRLSLAVKDMVEFSTRSLSNAKQIGEDALVLRINRLLTPVLNGSQIVQRDVDELEAYFWSVDRLAVSASVKEGPGQRPGPSPGDALDQLILCARSLKHDVTEIANFIALNSSTLFKEQNHKASVMKPESQPHPPKATQAATAQEDYDYVSLIPTSEAEAENPPTDKTPTPSPTPTAIITKPLDPRDEQLLEFYSAQIGVTAPLLSQSISTFISTITGNEGPERFNVHLKYVILLAYRLLFAGDTVHRNLTPSSEGPSLRDEVEEKSNDLHKAILALYEASKLATREFPKIGPMQQMVDKVWATTQAATKLKKTIFSASYASNSAL